MEATTPTDEEAKALKQREGKQCKEGDVRKVAGSGSVEVDLYLCRNSTTCRNRSSFTLLPEAKPASDKNYRTTLQVIE